MENFIKFIDQIDAVLGGNIMVFMLLGIGLLFTLVLGLPQIVKLGRAFKLMFGGIFGKKESGAGGLSSFQALATAVAAQVGTGNVGGVATAIAAGGPGAVFWMWITALLGMSTIFAEAVLAQKYRGKRDGELVGGPAFYINKGVGAKSPALAKFLAVFFAIAIILALGLAGNMVQSNSISNALNSAFNIPLWVVGVALAIVSGLIFMGGVQRIGRFAELVVPFMAVIYVVGSVVLLIMNFGFLGEALALIFKHAFTPAAAAGGFAGAVVKEAIRRGVQRGLFSNEAGMGSTPHAHAVAQVKHPAEQGLIAMCGVFFDTIIICTATALAILVTHSHQVEGLQGVAITMNAFNETFGNIGGMFLAICLMFFAFTTIVGWYYFGESNVRYLFGKAGLIPYQILVVVAVFLGAIMKVDVVWTLNGFLNNLMVYPNVIALLILTPVVIKIYKDYNRQVKAGGAITYNYDEE